MCLFEDYLIAEKGAENHCFGYFAPFADNCFEIDFVMADIVDSAGCFEGNYFVVAAVGYFVEVVDWFPVRVDFVVEEVGSVLEFAIAVAVDSEVVIVDCFLEVVAVVEPAPEAVVVNRPHLLAAVHFVRGKQILLIHL